MCRSCYNKSGGNQWLDSVIKLTDELQPPRSLPGEDTRMQTDIWGHEKPVIIKGKAKISQLSLDQLAKDKENLKRMVNDELH